MPYGKHDDYVDTCTQAWQLIKEQYLVAHPLDPDLFDEWDDKPIKTNLIEKRYYSQTTQCNQYRYFIIRRS